MYPRFTADLHRVTGEETTYKSFRIEEVAKKSFLQFAALGIVVGLLNGGVIYSERERVLERVLEDLKKEDEMKKKKEEARSKKQEEEERKKTTRRGFL